MSKVMSQREAVYSAICSVTENTEFDGQVELSKEEKEQVYGMLTEGFRSGTIHFEDTPSNREKLSTPSKLNAYVSGLVSNWLRKDPRLNGNTKYVAKNPGSRAGSGDAQLKALKVLATKFANDSVKLAEINKHISTRMSQIADEKAAKSIQAIDITKLPADLVESLGLK